MPIKIKWMWVSLILARWMPYVFSERKRKFCPLFADFFTVGMRFGIKNLNLISLSSFEFHENRRKERRGFRRGINKFIFTLVRRNGAKFYKKRRIDKFCKLVHGAGNLESWYPWRRHSIRFSEFRFLCIWTICYATWNFCRLLSFNSKRSLSICGGTCVTCNGCEICRLVIHSQQPGTQGQ